MSATIPSWQVGEALDEVELPPVDRLTLIRYAGASGDYNPIHTIDEEAARTGLPGIIQHGMLTMGQIGARFSPYLDEGFIEHFHTRFSGMLFLGDVLRIGGKVSAVSRDEGRETFSFDLYARTADGRSIARSTLRLVCLASR